MYEHSALGYKSEMDGNAKHEIGGQVQPGVELE